MKKLLLFLLMLTTGYCGQLIDDLTISGNLVTPSNSNAVYFSANLTATGSGTTTNPYGCSGKDTGAVVRSLNPGTNSTLIFLPGNYSFSTPLSVTNGMVISGYGSNVTKFIATTTLSTGMTAFWGPPIIGTFNTVSTSSYSASHITVTGINLVGNSSSGATPCGIGIFGYGYNTIQFCKFSDFPAVTGDAYPPLVGFTTALTDTVNPTLQNRVNNCVFTDFHANTTTLSGIGAVIAAYGTEPAYVEVFAENNTIIGDVPNAYAAWHSFGGRGSFSNNYVKGTAVGVWDDTNSLNYFTIKDNYFQISGTSIGINCPNIQLIVTGNVLATGDISVRIKNSDTPLISNNRITSTLQPINIDTTLTNATLIGNVFTGGTLYLGTTVSGTISFLNNRFDGAAIGADLLRTGKLVSVGNRGNTGAAPLQLSDTLAPLSGTNTFSSGVIVFTNSALITGQKLSITQNADGTVANTGVAVTAVVGNGFATATSSSNTANNSFNWTVSVSP